MDSAPPLRRPLDSQLIAIQDGNTTPITILMLFFRKIIKTGCNYELVFFFFLAVLTVHTSETLSSRRRI